MTTNTPDTTEMVTLKPCPFCDGEAADMGDHRASQIGCVKCEASTGPWFAGENGYAKAAGVWNTRPDSAGVPDGLVERHSPMSTIIEDDADGFQPVEVLTGNCVYLWQGDAQITVTPKHAQAIAAALSARPTPKVDAAIIDVARIVSLLRGNLEDEDRRMAVENCNALIEYLESGEPVRDLSSARQLANAISVRIAEADGAGRSRSALVRPLRSLLTGTTRGAEDTQAEVVRLREAVKDILRGPDGEEYTDYGMEDAFFRWPVIARAIDAALQGEGSTS